MIIYNVTVKIESDIRPDWEDWMKKVHIPDVMQTGHFTAAELREVKIDHDDGDTTFSVQYKCKSITELENYQKSHAQRLQAEHTARYKGKYVAFRTLMNEIATFSA